MTDEAAALRELAALLRSGSSLHAAVAAWPRCVPPTQRPAVTRCARQVRLGRPVEAAARSELAPLGLSSALAIHRRAGGDLAGIVSRAADMLEARYRLRREAEAASAAALLSARMVATLPLLSVPLLPMTKAPLFDRPGIALLVGGAALMWAGFAWMRRSIPSPDEDRERAIRAAETIASALDAGAGLRATMSAIAAEADAGSPWSLAARRVRLGMSWSAALAGSGDADLGELGVVIARAERAGVPSSAALRTWADSKLAAVTTEFEATIRRAAVKLAVPLALCVLPSFGLMGVVPFLRGLAGG